MKNLRFFQLYGSVLSILLMACNNSEQSSSKSEYKSVADTPVANNEEQTRERLRRFDSLDFQFYSNQQWDSFAISHDANIKVHYPDGTTTTTGLFPQHIDMLKQMFTFAPDTKITSHPVKFGSGDWTTVIGEMTGTFSKPMYFGRGKPIPPTNKKFKMTMCTVGHWKDGKMIEEYFFWDNLTMLRQLGLAQ